MLKNIIVDHNADRNSKQTAEMCFNQVKWDLVNIIVIAVNYPKSIHLKQHLAGDNRDNAHTSSS